MIGKKIGVTSAAVQNMLGVHQPDFGFLTDRMHVRRRRHRGDQATRMIQPRAEAEIALILKADLRGPGVTPAQVLGATGAIAPCFEVVDSRIGNWDIRIVDTVADNASCGVFVLGAARVDPRGLDLAALQVRVWKNEQPLSEGLGSAVQGSPLASVAWLANTLGCLRRGAQCRRHHPLRVAGAAGAGASRGSLPAAARGRRLSEHRLRVVRTSAPCRRRSAAAA